MAFIEQDRRSRLPSITAVVLIHAGIGYAFLSGLAYTVLPRGPDILQLIQIDDTPPPPPLDRVQPPPRSVAPPQAAANVAVPEQIVLTPSDPVTIDVQPLPPVLTRNDAGPAITPSRDVAPVIRATAARAVGERGRWIGTEDYPASALRQNEEGSVGITVRLGTDGRVTACQVSASSGFAALDRATCRLYAARARFTPATENGQPVATTMQDRISWRLPR